MEFDLHERCIFMNCAVNDLLLAFCCSVKKKKKMVLASAWNEKQSRVSVIKNARDAE